MSLVFWLVLLCTFPGKKALYTQKGKILFAIFSDEFSLSDKKGCFSDALFLFLFYLGLFLQKKWVILKKKIISLMGIYNETRFRRSFCFTCFGGKYVAGFSCYGKQEC